jgi:CTP:molybdopterin cytidylyltransferase MocA
MDVTGIVLAAGAGTRMGTPKALMRFADGTPWIAHATALLQAAGCTRVLVVLGAAASDAVGLVPPGVDVVVARDWALGLSHSLAAGLATAAGASTVEAALVVPVDVPGLPVTAAQRVLAARGDLRQAVYEGRPGHPVFIAASHWAAVMDSLDGDHGARPYLVEHGVTEVECSDLWDGLDVDRP